MTDVSQKLKIMTKDGMTVEVDSTYASYSELIKGFIEDQSDDSEIPINIVSSVLKKAIEFCKYIHQ